MRRLQFGEPIIGTYNPFANRFMPTRFKHTGKRPVKGGRWSVRKYCVPPGVRPWRAWTEPGTMAHAQRLSRRFHTQAEAMEWATGIAKIFATTKDDADRRIRIQRFREKFYRREGENRP